MVSRSSPWKASTTISAIFFLAALAGLPQGTRAADEPKKPDAKESDKPAAKDDAKATDKADKTDKADNVDETPEQAAKRIVKMVPKDIEGYEKEKAKFLEKYPDRPERWDFKLLDAKLGMMTSGPSPKAKAIVAEILAAKDAPPIVREQASVMNIQGALRGASPEKQTEMISTHIKDFPESKVNGQLAMMLVMTVSGGDPEKSLPAVEKLAASDLKPISEAATRKVTQLKSLIELKKSPMELKFTAVDGGEVDLANLRGKVVLIDFWATWCGPCVAGLPEVIDLYGKYHDKGLEIVGISFDQDKDALTKFVEKKEMSWVQYFDGKGWQNEYGRKYGINAIPMMWLVGKDGKVIDFEARRDLKEKIEKLLSE